MNEWSASLFLSVSSCRANLLRFTLTNSFLFLSPKRPRFVYPLPFNNFRSLFGPLSVCPFTTFCLFKNDPLSFLFLFSSFLSLPYSLSTAATLDLTFRFLDTSSRTEEINKLFSPRADILLLVNSYHTLALLN